MKYFKQILLVITLWCVGLGQMNSQTSLECLYLSAIVNDKPVTFSGIDLVKLNFQDSLISYKPEDFTVTFTDAGGNVLQNYFLPTSNTRIVNYKVVHLPTQNSCSNKLVIIGIEGTLPISCKPNLHYSIMPSQNMEMEPSDFLDFDNVNNELYDLIINDPQGNILTNNILQYDVDTRTYEVQITEKSNGNKCWTSFSVSSFQTSHAIASCDEFVIASLTQTGHCVITPQSLDDGSSNFVSMWSSKTEFNCDDVNITQTVKLSVANSDNIISQCSSNIKIQDKLAPIVLMKNNPTVHLNGITPTQLTPDMVASYFDNCEFVSLQVVPSTIDCNSANPTEVTLIAKDKGGSTVSASTFVGYTVNSSSILSCNDEVEIEITGLDSVRITPEMLLEGNYTCDDNFDVTLSFNNFEFPLPVVTQSDIGKNLTFEVKNTTIGNSCWGSLIVKKPVDCTIPFVVCDTRCSEGVPGDCNSGYTVTDNIDWPCDFESYVCDDDLFERFSPGDLVALHGIPKEQVYPQIINYPCSAIFTDFADQYEPIGNANSGEKKVIRTWTVLDWMTGNTYTYVQEFYLLSGHSVICDVFPWDTPFGDCASGHTDQDAVEWPADITVSRGGIAINILRNNPNIHINNVEPRIMASCNFNYIVSYTDQFNQTDPDSITVKRTWKVEDNFTNDEVTFIQKITITGQSANQNVCAATFTGIPISDVDMQLGTTTESGCADIVFAPNFEIKPSKVSKAKEGVDIMDLVMVYEHILGLRELNSYQKIAADVTNSGYISTLDLVMMQRIVDGTANDWSLVPVWKFLDKNHTVVNGVITPFKESINTNDLLSSNQFLGIKMGDIDGSYRDPGTSRPITYAALKGTDDVLNKGETYELILKSDRSQSLVAAQLEFDIKDKGINIIGVEGNNLPGFDPTQHVKMSNDKLIIQWYIDLQKNPLGINILNNQEMVRIHYTATKNSVLSDVLSLNSEAYNSIKQAGDRDPSLISLHWESKILNDIEDYVNNNIRIFPNPFTGKVKIQGIENNVQYSVMDATGSIRTQGKVPIAESIDLNVLEAGFYFMKIQEEGKNPSIHKMIKVD